MEKVNIETHHLFDDFPKITKQQWLEKAVKDLKGEDPFEKFAWQQGESMELGPYYDGGDVSDLQYLQDFHHRMYDQDSATGEYRDWSNLQIVPMQDERVANAVALDALNNGADGICFDIAKADVDLSILLKDILLQHCYVAFRPAKNPSDWLKEYLQFTQQLGVAPQTLRGHLHYEPIDTEGLATLMELVKDYSGFRVLEVVQSQKSHALSPDKLLSLLLTRIVTVLDKLTEVGFPAEKVLKSCFLSVYLGTDYFLDMCMLKALRVLLFQIGKAYGTTLLPEDFFLYALARPWDDEHYQPHEEILKGTSAAMAAIIGGCSGLSILPKENSPMETRICRNISTILKEEAYLSKMVDPMAGAYYLDYLTDKLVKSGWEVFLKMEQEQTVS